MHRWSSLARVAQAGIVAGLCVIGVLAEAARYGFETGVEGWEALAWDPGATNVSQSAFWGYGGSLHSLSVGCSLSNDGDKAWAGVTFPAQSLHGSQITMRVYCPSGASGTNAQSWAWTQLRLWVKDSAYRYQETLWDAFRIPPGVSTQTVTHTVTAASGFDSTNVIQFGLQVYWRGQGAYRGPLYIDEAGFGAPFSFGVSNLQYDFEQDAEGFGPTDDPGNLAITSVVQTAGITPPHGAGCLRLNVNLDGNVSARDAGEAWVDAMTHEPFGVPVPLDLEGKEAAIYVYCPAGSRGPTNSPNGLRVFVKDDQWRSEYGTWTPVVEEAWQKIVLVPSTAEPTNGYRQAGFDPTAIRAVGLNFAANSTSAAYAGPLYMDAVCLQVSPAAPFAPPAFEKYSFDSSADGWEPSSDSANAAATNVVRVTNAPSDSTGALAVDLDLVGGDAAKGRGEAFVDMNRYPPFGALPPLDLKGKTVRAWVYCPEGLQGEPSNPNGLQLFVKDSWWRAFYGASIEVHEGYWYEITVTPSTNAESGGYMEAGFDPTSIIAVGLHVGTASGSTAAYSGRLYLDGVSFPAAADLPVISNEQCGFETDVDGFIPTGDAGSAAVTGAVRCAGIPAASGSGVLRVDVNLDGGNAALDGGEIGADLQYFAPLGVDVPVDLDGREAAIYVYSPQGARGDTYTPNGLQVVVKDAAWKTEMGPWTPVVEGVWQKIALVASTNTPAGGFKDAGFNPARIRSIGLKFAAGSASAAYAGPLYVDAACFPAAPEPLVNLRYGFETGAEGWEHETYSGSAAVTGVVPSAAAALEGLQSLRLDVAAHGGATPTQGAAKVDMRWNPPPMAVAPVDLDGKTVSAYVYCPPGSDSGDPAHPNLLRLFVKDTNWLAAYGAPAAVRDGHWVRVKLVPAATAPEGGSMDAGFDPTAVLSIGLGVEMAGDYDGPLYVDHVSFPLAFTNVQYDFETSEQGFVPCDDPGNLAITAAVRTASFAAARGDACLRLDVSLDGADSARDAGEVTVDMQYYPPGFADVPMDLEGREVALYVHCPAGLQGNPTNANGLRVVVKDDQWRSEYGAWTSVQEGDWMKVSLTPSRTEPAGGYMAPGFDPSRIRLIGLNLAAGCVTAAYSGPLYLDAVSFSPDGVTPGDLRYGFETGVQGWTVETWPGVERITQAVQSASAALEGAHALRLDVDVNSGMNPTQGAAGVDMRYAPPPQASAPFDLDGDVVRAYVFCPTGTQSSSWSSPNLLRLYVKDSSWKSSYGPSVAMVDGQWVRLMLPVSTSAPAGGSVQEGFNPMAINVVGVEATMHGQYHGPVYLDHVSFRVQPLGGTNTDHSYTFDEPNAAARYPAWRPDPDGWEARAWTSTYVSAAGGCDGSAALAADAVFAPTNAAYEWRKGVFLIWYNPPINLEHKTHRTIQAKIKFSPGAGAFAFNVSMNVYDKDTGQWYTKNIPAGGDDWTTLQFNLDNAAEYDGGSPVPMSLGAIGGVAFQVFGNTSYTGTVLLDDVVIGGVEEDGVYPPVQGGIVGRDGRRFVLDGTNFYFAGVNIEYLSQCLALRTVEELLDLTTNLHLDVVRAWAFHEGSDFSYQPARGVWNEAAFENLDRVIAMAGDRNLRLMLGLVDNWGHNGGMFKYMEWVLSEHPESLPEELRTNSALGSVALHDQFFVNSYAKQWYRDYVTTLLRRTNSVTGVPYRDDPTIFAWEIVNEPRCETDMENGLPYGSSVHHWIREMSDFVRTLDPNHLLTAGEEGGYITTFSNLVQRAYYQELPRNSWLYGLRGDTNSGAGAMADFISDYRSETAPVSWQLGTFSNRGAVVSEMRGGCSNISLCPFRLYIDDREYNLWNTNWNGYNQRREWIVEHARDAHQTINKPVVLEEFGFHAFGWSYQGFYGQYQFVPIPKYYEADRVDAYREIYGYVEDFDLDGSFFWNLGYSGMWEDPWHLCEDVGDWWPETGWSDATAITTDTNLVVQGQRSLKLAFDPAKGNGKAVFCLITNEQWVIRLEGGQATGVNRVKYFWNVYNPGSAVNVAIALRVRDPWGDWYESAEQTITTGWNRVRFDLSAGTWKSARSNWQNTDFITDVLEDVQQVIFLVYGNNGAGCVYLDNITIRRDDGFIIYADDPVCPVIREHADRMREKSRRYTVHLACAVGEDSFPHAVAEQSNYTGAASCWMLARYLNGEAFTQSQAQVYAATSHDPLHNNEIFPWSAASWAYAHAPAGYYFSGRWRPTLEDALREIVYWVDYVPAGGRRVPTLAVCATNWGYKVVRGFQASRKPYDGGYQPSPDNVFTVYGFWLNDPAVGGLGGNLYVAADDMASVFLPSTTNSQFWLVAEPPSDGAALAAATEAIDGAIMELAEAAPNAWLAAQLGGRSSAQTLAGGATAEDGGTLEDCLPPALRDDPGFMDAFRDAGVVRYYHVNTNTLDHYVLAVGGVRGPATARYVLKLGMDGSLKQATWSATEMPYEPLPGYVAEWAARNSLGEDGGTAVLEDSLLASGAGASAFLPHWEMNFDVNGTQVFTLVRSGVDLGGDADDDGMTDGEELYAGSDPDDALSVFSVEGGRAAEYGPDQVLIRWHGAPGRTYTIDCSTNLLSGFTKLASGVASAHPEENAYPDELRGPTVYYRVRAE